MYHPFLCVSLSCLTVNRNQYVRQHSLRSLIAWPSQVYKMPSYHAFRRSFLLSTVLVALYRPRAFAWSVALDLETPYGPPMMTYPTVIATHLVAPIESQGISGSLGRDPCSLSNFLSPRFPPMSTELNGLRINFCGAWTAFRIQIFHDFLAQERSSHSLNEP